MTLILRAPQSLTTPIPGNPALPARVLISDGFTGGDKPNIIGRMTDSALGGLPIAWEGDPSVVAITSGTLRRGTSTEPVWFTGVKPPESDYEASLVVNARPVGASAFLDVRRASPMGAGSPDAYRLTFSNSMYLQKRSGGTSTTLLGTSLLPTVEIGKRYGLRVRGALLEVTVNGAVVASYTDASPLSGPGWTGIAGTSTITSFEFDDVIVRATSGV